MKTLCSSSPRLWTQNMSCLAFEQVFGLALCSAFLFSTSSLAQAPSQHLRYAKKTIINFDDDVVEGRLTSSDLELHSGPKKTRHASILRVRQDFRTEILHSVEAL